MESAEGPATEKKYEGKPATHIQTSFISGDARAVRRLAALLGVSSDSAAVLSDKQADALRDSQMALVLPSGRASVLGAPAIVQFETQPAVIACGAAPSGTATTPAMPPRSAIGEIPPPGFNNGYVLYIHSAAVGGDSATVRFAFQRVASRDAADAPDAGHSWNVAGEQKLQVGQALARLVDAREGDCPMLVVVRLAKVMTADGKHATASARASLSAR